MADEVVLVDYYPSMFGMRVRVALAEKGVLYEYREEDLDNKSSLFLEMNPVHKKIPILIHNGKPISESMIIVEYIDEVWKDKSPLLPQDPYQRAQARFWADFINKKVYDTGKRIWSTNGEERETAKNEMLEILRSLEGQLGKKPYFGGDSFGFVDVALVGFSNWFLVYETFGNFKIEHHCPMLHAWVKRCMQKHSVATSMAHLDKIYDYVFTQQKLLGVE